MISIIFSWLIIFFTITAGIYATIRDFESGIYKKKMSKMGILFVRVDKEAKKDDIR